MAQKVLRTNVPFGERTIEGFLLPEDLWTPITKFAVSKTQSVLLAYPDCNSNQASRQSIRIINSKVGKKIAPQGIQSIQKLQPEGERTRVDLIYLNDLILFLKICAKSGSENASDFLFELAGLSLEQIFSDAFNIRFEKQERQEWAKARQSGKAIRRTLTDAVTEYIARHLELSENDRHWMFTNVSEHSKIAKNIRYLQSIHSHQGTANRLLRLQ